MDAGDGSHKKSKSRRITTEASTHKTRPLKRICDSNSKVKGVLVMSTHEIPVVVIKKEPHPNADTLSIVRVFGWQCVVKSSEWEDGQLAAYVPPDYVVPETPQFEFLRDKTGKFKGRITVKKFRGEWSQGLLVRAPDDSVDGDNVMEQLGITRYQPPVVISGEDQVEGPCLWGHIYNVETFLNYPSVFQPGEWVVITEKLHGENMRAVFNEDEFFVGSHRTWKRRGDERGAMWKAALDSPWLEVFCRNHPGCVVYGERYGWVQSLRYGAIKNQSWFRVFDVFDSFAFKWWDFCDVATNFTDDERVPLLYKGEFSREILESQVTGLTTVPGATGMREGVVIRSWIEQEISGLGRKVLKRVSDKFLEKDSE